MLYCQLMIAIGLTIILPAESNDFYSQWFLKDDFENIKAENHKYTDDEVKALIERNENNFAKKDDLVRTQDDIRRLEDKLKNQDNIEKNQDENIAELNAKSTREENIIKDHEVKIKNLQAESMQINRGEENINQTLYKTQQDVKYLQDGLEREEMADQNVQEKLKTIEMQSTNKENILKNLSAIMTNLQAESDQIYRDEENNNQTLHKTQKDVIFLQDGLEKLEMTEQNQEEKLRELEMKSARKGNCKHQDSNNILQNASNQIYGINKYFLILSLFIISVLVGKLFQYRKLLRKYSIDKMQSQINELKSQFESNFGSFVELREIVNTLAKTSISIPAATLIETLQSEYAKLLCDSVSSFERHADSNLCSMDKIELVYKKLMSIFCAEELTSITDPIVKKKLDKITKDVQTLHNDFVSTKKEFDETYTINFPLHSCFWKSYQWIQSRCCRCGRNGGRFSDIYYSPLQQLDKDTYAMDNRIV